MSKPRLETIWEPIFHGTLANPAAPGGKVDMYLVVDTPTGEGMITIAVPHCDTETAQFVCDAVNARIQEEKKRVVS